MNQPDPKTIDYSHLASMVMLREDDCQRLQLDHVLDLFEPLRTIDVGETLPYTGQLAVQEREDKPCNNGDAASHEFYRIPEAISDD